MTNYKSKHVLAALGAMAFAFACSAGPEDATQYGDQATTDLSFQRRSLWKPAVPAIDFTGIALCFPGAFATDAKYATFRQAAIDSAKDWENATDRKLVLTPIGKCGSGIEIRLDKMDDKGGFTQIGMDSEPIHVNRDYVNNAVALKRVILHELGHKLGFTHEQVHPNSTCPKRQKDRFLFWEFTTDTVGYSPFPYDQNSIMNYCGGNALSASDIDAVQRLYGGNEYNLSDGRTFWLRSDHGQFLGAGGFSPELRSRFKFTNVGKKGQDVRYGDKVTIQWENGSYISAGSHSGLKGSDALVYALTSSATPFAWDVSGFGSAQVGVNEPVAFSALVGKQRVYLAASLTIKTGVQDLGIRLRNETSPPQSPDFIWRILGPGPETAMVCGTGESRCGNNCCGKGVTCVDASIGMCCGQFEERCGNVCCDPEQACISGVCQAPPVPPKPPAGSCGATPTCSQAADCPANFDFCSGGCCRQLH